MTLTPLPTQVQDAAFLVKQGRAALFSEPGTGKTITALEAWNQVGGRLVVVAPPIALRMWKANIDSYCDKRAQILTTGKDQIDWDADAVIVSYQLIGKFQAKLRGHAKAIVLDESDALKSLNSQRTTYVYGKRACGTDCLIEGCDYVWPLTGSPIRRYADDIYPHLRALHPDLLWKQAGVRTYEQFINKFCFTQLRRFHARQRATPTVAGNKNEKLLNTLIYDNGLAVRRTIHDVAAEMPPLTFRDVYIQYDDSDDLREATGDALGAGEQEPVMATARRLLGLAKSEWAAKYCIDVWERVSCPLLVFYWHREAGDSMQWQFEGADMKVGRIDGSTPSHVRADLEAKFNAGEIDVLLGQIASMGVAINLQQGSHYGVFAERDWSPAASDQALRRLWRLGQDTHVQIDICHAEHPLDEAVSMVQDRKDTSTKRIVG